MISAPGNKILQTARLAIQAEAQALEQLALSIGPTFIEVTQTIARMVGGRVILSGIGKSGHIARKIAATFSSTGTPALYIHPTEASHGDLGMIGHQDVVLVLSKSGESQELSDIVNYCRRHGITLVAVTAVAQSSLGKMASHVLLIPNCPEAQPLGIAPTTSTVMSLALGDALALAVLEIRDFQVANFREFHPGGKLGRKLMRVRDIMHAGDELPIMCLGESLGKAVLEMTRTRFGCVGVVDDGQALVGIFTDGDLRRHFSASAINQRVDELMTRRPKEISPDALVSDVAHLFSIKRIPSVFVTENGCPVGIVHVHDLLGGSFL
ncbi:MAG: KpsF/GutQ family sugar-phosphate isomerase [Rhodoferax sp.]|nr:KpsF/GutQ family sugar-phosphate isomerase [Rhodoferax sp.]